VGGSGGGSGSPERSMASSRYLAKGTSARDVRRARELAAGRICRVEDERMVLK